mgnify:CR=1 FL=1
MVIAVVNEGTLFMYDAEQKVRQYLLNDYQIQGVISLPAGAFLPLYGKQGFGSDFYKRRRDRQRAAGMVL